MPSKIVSIKIILAIISLTFLLASTTPSYASSTLRPNLMGDGKGPRLKAIVEEVAPSSKLPAEKGAIIFQRPMWTISGWGEAKNAIKQKFTTTKERKEALDLVRILAKKLAENKIDPGYTLQYAIPAAAKVAKTPQELKDICDTLLNLNIKFAENKIDPGYTLQYAIPAVAPLAKTPQELKDICDTLLNLNIKLIENKIEPYYVLQYAIPMIASTVQSVSDLQLFCIHVVPKVMQTIPAGAVQSYTAIEKTFTAENISMLLLLQRKYGNFDIRYKYTPQEGYYDEDGPGYEYVGRGYVETKPEKYKIEFLPPRGQRGIRGWFNKSPSVGL